MSCFNCTKFCKLFFRHSWSHTPGCSTKYPLCRAESSNSTTVVLHHQDLVETLLNLFSANSTNFWSNTTVHSFEQATMPFCSSKRFRTLQRHVIHLYAVFIHVLLKHTPVVQSSVAHNGNRNSSPGYPATNETVQAVSTWSLTCTDLHHFCLLKTSTQTNHIEHLILLTRSVGDFQ